MPRLSPAIPIGSEGGIVENGTAPDGGQTSGVGCQNNYFSLIVPVNFLPKFFCEHAA